MSSRIGVGHNLNNPLSRAIKKYNEDDKRKKEQYAHAPRGTNFNSIPEIPPVNYEPFVANNPKNIVSGIITVIVIVLVVLLVGYLIAYFFSGKKTSFQDYYKNNGGETCPECNMNPCVCVHIPDAEPIVNDGEIHLQGGQIPTRKSTFFDDEIDEFDNCGCYARRNNLLI